jgi:N-acetyl-anhydromuramyl-L-alanine amidase AmpD
MHICYIGILPTVAQWSAMLTLCVNQMKKFGIRLDRVYGHYDYYLRKGIDVIKACPNFNMDAFRGQLGLLMI